MRNFINLVEMSQQDAIRVFVKNGVNPNNLTDDELKSRYRKLMMQHHPDRGGDLETAKEISGAYDILKKLEKRTASAASATTSPEPEAPADDYPNFDKIDHVKRYFEELSSGKPSQEWTVVNFDGRFFRGMFTIRGSAEHFPEMARIMMKWDRYYDSHAILAGTRAMMSRGDIALINTKGQNVSPFVTLHYESPNLNPANDKSFSDSLPRIIDAVMDGTFVSQNMMD